jgi:hypothetical protein
MMTGSAMRNPRIHPGTGSSIADSMIDGRTIVSGTPVVATVSSVARSPNAFVYAYASGQPSDCARARPASTIRSFTQSSRIFSVFSASKGEPAAPSSWRALAWNSFRRFGSRDAASTSARVRRAAATSDRQSTPMANGVSGSGSSGASPRRDPAT